MFQIKETSVTLRDRFTETDKAKLLLDAIDLLLSDMGYRGEYRLRGFERYVYGDDAMRYNLDVDIYEREAFERRNGKRRKE